MTKLFAVFASVIFILNISACSTRKDEDYKSTDTPSPKKSTHTMSVQAETASQAASNDLSPLPEDTPSATSKVIDNKSITIIPQQDNKIIVTYPKYEINQCEIVPNDQSYTLQLTPGDYSDPKNAISTFLFDLYIKQSLCFDNIHRDIRMDEDNQAFIKTLFTMESLMLNLGQVDVLVLPKFKYYTDGVPYIFQNAAAYKTTEDNVIRFGNTCENNQTRQTTKGSFDTKGAALYFETFTTSPDKKSINTYFEAIKVKDDVFLYRILNLYQGRLQVLTVSTTNELLQAGYYEGKIPEAFSYVRLSKNSSAAFSAEKNGFEFSYYLFANDDGAIIPSAVTEFKK